MLINRHTRLFILLCLLASSTIVAQPDSSGTAYIPDEKQLNYTLGKTNITISISRYGSRNDLVLINLHDDEYTSVEAARSVLQQEGGILVKINNNGERRIRFIYAGKKYMVDPNRIFSQKGIQQTLKRHSRYSKQAAEQVKKFAQRLLSLIPKEARYVIALHNNMDGAPLSIHSYLPAGNLSVNARDACHHPRHDPDDFFLTTSQAVHQKICEAGYNSVWQHSQKAEQDGSLSIHFRNHRRISYVNCETEHGRTSVYRDMLKQLLAVIE